MVDSQSLGRENSGRFAWQRTSQIGFFVFDLGEQAVAQLPSVPPVAMQQCPLASGVRCWLTASSLRPVLQKETNNLMPSSRHSELFFVRSGSVSRS